MAINSKSISKNDLQLYIEDDISIDKKKFILEIEKKLSIGNKLNNDETEIINHLSMLRKVDNLFEEAIKNQPSIPKNLQIEINETIDLLSNKKHSFLKGFLNIKYLISSGIGAIVAITAMMLFPILSTNVAFRDVPSNINNSKVSFKNIPTSWIIKNNIAFALSHVSKEKELDTKEDVRVSLDDIIIFTLIPSQSKIIDIKYISNDGVETKLYTNLSIKKGINFVSKKLKIGLPIGIDKVQILENGKMILEKEIIVND